MWRLFFTRLFRAIRNIPAFLWESATWEYESCKRCGCAFRIMWDVEDEIWEKVMGDPDAPGCYCVGCFIKMAEKKGIVIHPSQIKVGLFYPEEPYEKFAAHPDYSKKLGEN